MRKSFFFTVVAAIALTSCQSDEPVMVNHGSSIQFRAGMASRGLTFDAKNLGDFKVAAFDDLDELYFPESRVTKTTSGSVDEAATYHFTSSSSLYYWPSDENQNLKFYAYAPESLGENVTVTLEKGNKVVTNFEPNTTVEEQVDFITAYKDTNKKLSEISGVELPFKHQLSQIRIMAMSESKDLSYQISGVRIGSVVGKGDFNFVTEEWTPDNSVKTTYEIIFDEPIDINNTSNLTAKMLLGQEGSGENAGFSAYLLPQELTPWNRDADYETFSSLYKTRDDLKGNTDGGAYISVLLTVKDTRNNKLIYPYDHTCADGSKKTCAWAAIPLSGTWLAGNRYTYLLDFTGGAGYVDPTDPEPGNEILKPIIFTVTVDSWKTGSVPYTSF